MATTEELMNEVQELTAKLQELQDIKGVERCKFDYWDAMDHKEWERLTNVFTPDFHWDSTSINGLVVDGNVEFVAGMSQFLCDTLKSCHQGMQHWIEIDSDTTAHGVWCFRDNLYNTITNAEFRGRGYYEDTYEKIDGVWYLKSTILTYNMSEGAYNKVFGDDAHMAFGVLA